MTGFDTATVAYHLRRLDSDGLGAFVADLWSARGYETTREGGVVEASNGTDSLRIGTTGEAWTPGAVDVVIAVDGTRDTGVADVRVVDAATLAEMLGYAIDRSEARDICRRHLGATPDALAPPPVTRLRRRADALVPAGPALVVGVVTLALVVGGVAGFTVLTGTSGGDRTLAGTGMVPATTPTPAGEQGEWMGATQFRQASPALVGTSDNGSFPPGVDSTGIEDIDTLAAAHKLALADQPHTIWVDWYRRRGYRPDGERVQRDIDITAEGDRYLIELTEEAGRNRSRLGAIYHDGDATYAASWDEQNRTYDRVFRISPRQNTAPTPESLRKEVVTRYLSTPTTNVTGVIERDGHRLYRIVGHGRPNTSASVTIRNYTVEALVDSEGFVRDVTVRVRVVHPDISPRREFQVKREITYDRVGRTEVVPPEWYERHTEE